MDQLTAVVRIHANTGYSGPLCAGGSTEHVRFYVSTDDGVSWTDAGTDSFAVHDTPGPRPLDHAVDVVTPLRHTLCFIENHPHRAGGAVVERRATAEQPELVAAVGQRRRGAGAAAHPPVPGAARPRRGGGHQAHQGARRHPRARHPGDDHPDAEPVGRRAGQDLRQGPGARPPLRAPGLPRRHGDRRHPADGRPTRCRTEVRRCVRRCAHRDRRQRQGLPRRAVQDRRRHLVRGARLHRLRPRRGCRGRRLHRQAQLGLQRRSVHGRLDRARRVLGRLGQRVGARRHHGDHRARRGRPRRRPALLRLPPARVVGAPACVLRRAGAAAAARDPVVAAGPAPGRPRLAPDLGQPRGDHLRAAGRRGDPARPGARERQRLRRLPDRPGDRATRSCTSGRSAPASRSPASSPVRPTGRRRR